MNKLATIWQTIQTFSKGDYGLGSLEVSQGLDGADFVALLNKTPQGVGSLYATASQASTRPWLLPPASAGLYGGAVYQQTPQDRIADILRVWVDEWLDSARAKDGAEDPRQRSLENAERASVAALRFSLKGTLQLMPNKNGLALWIQDKDRHFTKPTTSYSLNNVRPLALTDEAIAEGELVFFLLSDLRFRLAKCRADGCGCYFILKKWQRRYFRGTLCDKHQRSSSLESAKNATIAERLHAESGLYELAAKRFGGVIRNTSDWYSDPKLKSAIAAYLNECIARNPGLAAVYLSGNRKGITGKWLAHSKNWKGIENALKAAPTVASKSKSATKARRIQRKF